MPPVDGSTSWEPLGSEPAYDGYITVRRDRLRLPDGKESLWDVLEEPDSVAVVAVLRGNERVILASQYRVGPARVLDELPGGMIDPDETVESGGLRELLEETGYAAGAVYLAGFEWSSANSTRRKHLIVAAECVYQHPPQLDEEEFVTVRELSLTEFIDHVLSGELTDAGLAARGLLQFVRAKSVPVSMLSLQAAIREVLT